MKIWLRYNEAVNIEFNRLVGKKSLFQRFYFEFQQPYGQWQERDDPNINLVGGVSVYPICLFVTPKSWNEHVQKWGFMGIGITVVF